MRRFRSKETDSSGEEPLINLTPLIDVVFVVLITFMLIAPVLHLDHVELAQGNARPMAKSAKPHLSIHVKSDDTIWFQGRSLSTKQLEEALKKEKSSHPDYTPQIIQDRKASFGAYQTVKNTLEHCGFSEMDVVLAPL